MCSPVPVWLQASNKLVRKTAESCAFWYQNLLLAHKMLYYFAVIWSSSNSKKLPLGCCRSSWILWRAALPHWGMSLKLFSCCCDGAWSLGVYRCIQYTGCCDLQWGFLTNLLKVMIFSKRFVSAFSVYSLRPKKCSKEELPHKLCCKYNTNGTQELS